MKFLLPAVFLMAVGILVADTKPAMIVQAIQTDDPAAYVAAVAKLNARIKAVTGIETLRHVWIGDQAGEASRAIFVVSSFESAAAAAATQAKLEADAEHQTMTAQLKAIRKLGSSSLYKAIRQDGVYAGGAVYNTSINTADEDAYAKALDTLKAAFDANGFKDAKLNLYRVVSGRSDSSHLVVISLPSQQRVAELVDATTDTAILKEWIAASGKIRTVVRNGTYHEITK